MNSPKPELKVPVECYTRCVGFFRPISHMNPGIQQRIKDQKYYSVSKAVERIDHDKIKSMDKKLLT